MNHQGKQRIQGKCSKRWTIASTQIPIPTQREHRRLYSPPYLEIPQEPHLHAHPRPSTTPNPRRQRRKPPTPLKPMIRLAEPSERGVARPPRRPVPRPPSRVNASDTTGVPLRCGAWDGTGAAPREEGEEKEVERGSGFFLIWDVCQIAGGRARCKRGYCKVHIRFRGPSGGKGGGGGWWALRTGSV